MAFDEKSYQQSYRERQRQRLTERMTPLAAKCFLNDLERSGTADRRKAIQRARAVPTEQLREAK